MENIIEIRNLGKKYDDKFKLGKLIYQYQKVLL